MKTWLKFLAILWGVTCSTNSPQENSGGKAQIDAAWVAQKITQTCDADGQSLG